MMKALKIVITFALICAIQVTANPFLAVAGTSVSSAGTYSVSDNFDAYADASDLGAAANWDNNQGNWYVHSSGGDGSIRSNDAGSGDTLVRYSAWAGSNNQYVQATIERGASSDSGAIGLAARCSTAGAMTGYLLAYDRVNVYLYSYSAGSAGSIIAQQAKTYSNGTKLKLEVTGSGASIRLTGYEDTGSGWVIITGMNSATPGQQINSGVPGVHGWDDLGDSATTMVLDAWSAGDL